MKLKKNFMKFLNLKYYICFSFLIIVLSPANSQTLTECQKLKVKLAEISSKITANSLADSDLMSKTVDANDPRRKRLNDDSNRLLGESKVVMKKMIQLDCKNKSSQVNNNEQVNNTNPYYNELSPIDKASATTDEIANSAAEIANIWDNASSKLSSIEYSAPANKIDDGAEIAERIGEYNIGVGSKKIFGNLDLSKFEDSNDNSVINDQINENKKLNDIYYGILGKQKSYSKGKILYDTNNVLLDYKYDMIERTSLFIPWDPSGVEDAFKECKCKLYLLRVALENNNNEPIHVSFQIKSDYEICWKDFPNNFGHQGIIGPNASWEKQYEVYVSEEDSLPRLGFILEWEPRI